MPSQKSRAVAPQRARGHARVEAILEAAGAVFAERGYDQATMTEIAARAATAIGSLYRFFPTKEALGETLLRRFTDAIGESMKALAEAVPRLDASQLADTLMEHHIGRGPIRGAIQAIVDGRGDGPDLRRAFRVGYRARIATILRQANPALSSQRAQDCAAVLLHLFKGVAALAADDPRSASRSTAELRRVARLYLADVLSER